MSDSTPSDRRWLVNVSMPARLLLLGLDRHVAHGRPDRRLTDGFCVRRVVLLAPDERFDIDRCNQPNFMAENADGASLARSIRDAVQFCRRWHGLGAHAVDPLAFSPPEDRHFPNAFEGWDLASWGAGPVAVVQGPRGIEHGGQR